MFKGLIIGFGLAAFAYLSYRWTRAQWAATEAKIKETLKVKNGVNGSSTKNSSSNVIPITNATKKL